MANDESDPFAAVRPSSTQYSTDLVRSSVSHDGLPAHPFVDDTVLSNGTLVVGMSPRSNVVIFPLYEETWRKGEACAMEARNKANAANIGVFVQTRRDGHCWPFFPETKKNKNKKRKSSNNKTTSYIHVYIRKKKKRRKRKKVMYVQASTISGPLRGKERKRERMGMTTWACRD